MNILCFDTATNACAVGLQVNNVRYVQNDVVPRLHAQSLLPMIQSLIQKAGITLSDLNGIAFGCGPGSFMGVRLATGMAQGLAFGLSVPVIPISTLQVIAQTQYEKTGDEKVIAAWDARMQEIYWGKYICDENRIMQPQQIDALCTEKEIDKKYFHDLGFSFAGNVFSEEMYPDAHAMLSIAVQHYLDQQVISPELAHPHYVRDRVVHSSS